MISSSAIPMGMPLMTLSARSLGNENVVKSVETLAVITFVELIWFLRIVGAILR